jgi:hypothetical protein
VALSDDGFAATGVSELAIDPAFGVVSYVSHLGGQFFMSPDDVSATA